jgi:hypothetical protein
MSRINYYLNRVAYHASCRRERKELLLRNPEISVETLLQFGGFVLKASRRIRIIPEFARQARASAFCVVDIPLYLARSGGTTTVLTFGSA